MSSQALNIKFIDSTKTVKSAKGKKVVVEKEPTAATLVNFLNIIVKGSQPNKKADADTFANSTKKLQFKEIPNELKAADHVIDLTKYDGLQEVKEAYAVIAKYNEKISKEAKEETGPKADSRALTNMIREPIMRGYCSMAEEKFVQNKRRAKKAEEKVEEETEEKVEEETETEEETTNLLQDAINTLDLPNPRSIDEEDVLNAIKSIICDTDAFKIKAFNQVFPLGVHDTEKEATMVNNKYLQHMIPHFDDILTFIINNIDEADLKYMVIEEVMNIHKDAFFAEHNKNDNHDYLLKIQYENFMKHFETNHDVLIQLLKDCVAFKKGVNEGHNEKNVKEFIKTMPVCRQVKKNTVQLDEKATLADADVKLDKDIFELISNLRKYYTFVDLILDGKQYRESTTKSVVDYSEIYNAYTAFCNKHKAFCKKYVEIEPTVENLMTLMIQSVKFIATFKDDNVKEYPTMASTLKNPAITFKIAHKLSKKFKELYALSYDEIAEAVHAMLTTEPKGKETDYRPFADDLSSICVVEAISTTPTENATKLAKIGEIANDIKDVQISKNTRVAIGLAITYYVIVKTNLVLQHEASKKSGITIYLKI